MGKWLLVVCLQVLLWVTQSTETSELCDSDDGSAYLQSHLKASSALQVAGGANASKRRTNCRDSAEFDAGVCDSSDGTDECTGCTDGGLIPEPSSLTGFPAGSFLCLNDQDGSGQVCENADKKTYTFKDGNDFMTCKGYQSCVNDWFVENVAAVCCSVASESGQSCKGIAKFTMTTDESSSYTHDACCDGYQTCDGDSEFKGVNSMSCRAENACDDSTFELARNLYCSTTSLVSSKQGPSMCTGSTFTFTAGGQHCLQCLGESVCLDSDFIFDVASEVSLYCVGKLACQGNVKITLKDNSKLFMVCDGEDSCKGSNVKVTLGQNSEILLTCKGSAACNSMDIDKGSGSKCKCTDSNSGDCPGSCSDDVDVQSVCAVDAADSACCAGNPSKNGGHPDCAECSTTTTSTGGGGGDPHIDTFDGQHYLLLKQGSFSFWHFSGFDAEVMSAKWLKKLPVDFKMYAHYSGHLSYTKGILLLDSSGLQQPSQMLEITSEDCLWRASQPGGANASWRTIEKPQLLSVPDKDGDKFTAFRFSPSRKGQKMHLGLLMKQRDGAWKSVGTLFVRCKPGYHINMKMSMSSKKEMGLVDGQIASHGHTSAGDDHALPTASFLHFMNQRVRTDQEFLTPKSWTDLGGSKQAAEYLGDVDEEGPAFLKGCSESERLEADKTCKKYLGQPPVGGALQSFENSLRNCVFDVCNGGGEVAAELAAEILYAE